jgi:aminoglycoside phosphotransferase (APT) family kinase protein
MEISESLVARLVATQFPRFADRPVRQVVPGGWDNRTFRLGDDLVVRLPSGEGYAAQPHRERAAIRALAPRLPQPIPEPVGFGSPGEGYPFHWSIYRWLDGVRASATTITDDVGLARDLSSFLRALHRVDGEGGPLPGLENWYRGASLTVWEDRTRDAIEALEGTVDTAGAVRVWEAALAATWTGTDVWVHGDTSPGNLLLDQQGKLSGVIDFGCVCVGDPACDLRIAWTLFDGESRKTFREALPLDEGTWARARGWALWKALVAVRSGPSSSGDGTLDGPRRVIDAVIAETR